MNIKNFKKFAKKPCNFQILNLNEFVVDKGREHAYN